MAAWLPVSRVERRFLDQQEMDAVAELLNLPAPPDCLLKLTVRGSTRGPLLEVEYINEKE